MMRISIFNSFLIGVITTIITTITSSTTTVNALSHSLYPASFINARHGAIRKSKRNCPSVPQTFLGESKSISETDEDRPFIRPPGGGAMVGAWVVAMSIFIVKNYASEELWPFPQLADIPIPYLSLMHNLGNMIFSGSIITTTVIEWIVTDSNDDKIIPFWFDRVQKVERFMVLPALFLSIVSGMIRATVTYGTMMESPLHIKSSLHILSTFGLWWGITDRTTINRVSLSTESNRYSSSTIGNNGSGSGNDQEGNININRRLVMIRRISNIISCGFLIASYAMMTLKPGLANYYAST